MKEKHCDKCSYQSEEGLVVSGCVYCGCHNKAMKKEIQQTIYDFANGCRFCREPVISNWQGYGQGYSLGKIHHNKNCEVVKRDKEVGEAIHEQLIKSGYGF